jgi:phosphate:Na+ symporter
VAEPTLVLVVFFTVVKLAGVAAIWPVTPALVRFLETRFRAGEAAPARLAYLDRTVMEVPAVALAAAVRETERLRDMAEAATAAWLADPHRGRPALDRAAVEIRAIADQIAEYLARITGAALSPDEVARAQLLLRLLQHYVTALYDAQRAAAALAEAGILPEERHALQAAIGAVIARPETMSKARETALKADLAAAKDRLLAAAGAGRVGFEALDATLRGMNAEIRMLRRLRKGRHYLEDVEGAPREPMLESIEDGNGSQAGTPAAPAAA